LKEDETGILLVAVLTLLETISRGSEFQPFSMTCCTKCKLGHEAVDFQASILARVCLFLCLLKPTSQKLVKEVSFDSINGSNDNNWIGKPFKYNQGTNLG
jgi:hypothetical protein